MRPVRCSTLLVTAFTASLSALVLALPARAAQDRWFTTSDGVRLHLLEAGPPTAPPILFVPGWTMPAWIWQAQLAAFAPRYHVVAMDPRGQGSSDVPEGGYTPGRRGQDIAEVVQALGGGARRVLLVGWSLGVLDSLAYVHERGDGALAGLVLVDNSVGEPPAPIAREALPRRGPRVEREVAMRRFVASMFRRDPGPAYLDELTETALRTPPDAAAALLSYPVPRTYWREAVLSVRAPVLYIVRPHLAAQAANLAADSPVAETEVFEGAGHALFVDDAAGFDAALSSFIQRRVRW